MQRSKPSFFDKLPVAVAHVVYHPHCKKREFIVKRRIYLCYSGTYWNFFRLRLFPSFIIHPQIPTLFRPMNLLLGWPPPGCSSLFIVSCALCQYVWNIFPSLPLESISSIFMALCFFPDSVSSKSQSIPWSCNINGLKIWYIPTATHSFGITIYL